MLLNLLSRCCRNRAVTISRMKPLAVALLLLVLQIGALSQSAAPASQANSGAQQPGATQTVRVAELPPVSMSKDWSDWSYWLRVECLLF